MPTKGYKHTAKAKIKIGKKLKGRTPWIAGKHHTKKSNLKNSKAHSGENHYNWKGGKSLRYMKKTVKRKKPESCELCGAMGQICFDHDHKTNKFRGWICQRCNRVLGFVKDNSELLQSMASYLDNKK